LTTGASATGAVEGNFFGSSLSLEKEAKGKALCPSRQKEEHIQKSAKNSRVEGVEKLYFFL
jgi:hypothetical protein